MTNLERLFKILREDPMLCYLAVMFEHRKITRWVNMRTGQTNYCIGRRGER